MPIEAKWRAYKMKLVAWFTTLTHNSPGRTGALRTAGGCVKSRSDRYESVAKQRIALLANIEWHNGAALQILHIVPERRRKWRNLLTILKQRCHRTCAAQYAFRLISVTPCFPYIISLKTNYWTIIENGPKICGRTSWREETTG